MVKACLFTTVLAVVLATATAALFQTQTFDDEEWVHHHRRELIIHNATAPAMRSVSGVAAGQAITAAGCAKCEEITKVLLVIASNPAARKDADALIDDVCKAKFNSSATDAALCVDLGHLLVKVFVKLVHKAEGLAWDVPKTFCSNIVHACTQPCCNATTPFQPQQRYLAFNARQSLTASTEMRVTWVTLKMAPTIVQWRLKGGNASWANAFGTTRTYTEGGWIGVIHSAVMTKLRAGVTYEYRVGGMMAWSDVATFSTLPLNAGTAERPLRVIMYGDMGYGPNSNGNVKVLKQLVADGKIDFILHYGDISYADADEHHWDVFGRKMEGITSRVPYMTTPGNHEMYWNFTAYKKRMWMPEPGDGAPSDAMFYRFDVGNYMFLMINSEAPLGATNLDAVQMAWVKRQLVQADAAGMTAIASLHRPLYCSNGGANCESRAFRLRLEAEGVFDAHKSLKLVAAGHMHSYERLLPVGHSGKNVSSSYVNPAFPTYIISGAGGSREDYSGFSTPLPFSKVRLMEWGVSQVLMGRDTAGTTTLGVTFLLNNMTNGDNFTIVAPAN